MLKQGITSTKAPFFPLNAAIQYTPNHLHAPPLPLSCKTCDASPHIPYLVRVVGLVFRPVPAAGCVGSERLHGLNHHLDESTSGMGGGGGRKTEA